MRSLLTSSLLLLAGLSTLAGATEVSSTASGTPESAITPQDISYSSNIDDAAQNPLQMGSMAATDSPRHRQEKAHLMKRMSRKHGTWDSKHPRYRLLEALYGFSRYQERNMAEVNRWRSLYSNVKKAQKKALERAVNYKKKLHDIETLIDVNQALCDAMVQHAMAFYDIEQKELDAHIAAAEKAARVADRTSPSQTLNHFVRDWADAGANHRSDTFPCILNTLTNLSRAASSPPLKILLPGSGLGRLGTEIANLGSFQVSLNEWSAYMNIAYRFLLSAPTSTQSPFTIHPFLTSLSHHRTTPSLLRPINFPDSPPSPAPVLIEADFTTLTQTSYFDSIVTYFFIDTARNLISYFDTIHRLLKPGGRWVNLGPLMYGSAPFVQLSLDEVVAVVEAMGFVFEEMGSECGALTFGEGRVRQILTGYGGEGLLGGMGYWAQGWVVRKL